LSTSSPSKKERLKVNPWLSKNPREERQLDADIPATARVDQWLKTKDDLSKSAWIFLGAIDANHIASRLEIFIIIYLDLREFK
jgi:cephalosporin-C deacetylase-like acetyl esterase